MNHESPQPAAEHATSSEPRRNFFVSFLAGAIGLVVGVVPFCTGLLFFLDPLVRRRGGNPGESDGFFPVAPIDAIPSDGTPQLFTVRQDKWDAWTFYPQQEVGTVYICRGEDGELHAFNTRCPHLGCTVDYRVSEKDYYCPCHLSSFKLNGEKANPIPPRGLDELEVRVDAGQVLVKFQNFRATTPEKIPVT